jgi:hypothetical protein
MRMLPAEIGEQVDGRHGEILGHAQPQHAVPPDAGQRVMRLLVKGDDPARIA